MQAIVLLIMLTLQACNGAPAPPAAGPAPELRGWELASGKPPTKVEFAALLAACEDRGQAAAKGGLDSCLADLGLRHAEP
ncbi:MAG TPA: hypothetical protein VGR91_13425 [Stellaceae bacterium]|nr:hypothetical protein [Stellaceae bacterium]